MAVSDDLNRLAAQDIVYLSRFIQGGQNSASKQVFRGRLRQALSGNWVFNASIGQNGVVGFDLGPATEIWGSGESPAAGIQVNISTPILPSNPPFTEMITLTTLIPTDFTE
jgi:hypothetical protein